MHGLRGRIGYPCDDGKLRRGGAGDLSPDRDGGFGARISRNGCRQETGQEANEERQSGIEPTAGTSRHALRVRWVLHIRLRIGDGRARAVDRTGHQGIDTDWDVRFDQGLMDILNKCDGSTDAEDRTSDVRYVSPRQVPHFPFGGQARGILEAR